MHRNLKFYQVIDFNDNIQNYPYYTHFNIGIIFVLDIIININNLIEFQVPVVYIGRGLQSIMFSIQCKDYFLL